jgi:hypothetical protein
VYFNSSTVTISAWIKWTTAPDYWNGIVYDRASGAHGLSFGYGTELRYTWNAASNTWQWNSGLNTSANTWTFVALVVEPTKATIFLNDGDTTQSATNYVTHGPAGFSNILIGSDGNNGINRYFKGSIDDVRIYTIAMTPTQIEELREGGKKAESPYPFDNATDILLDTELNWVGSAKDTTTHDVYLGTTTSPPRVSEGQNETTYNPGILLPNTTYYWRIDEVDDSGVLVGDLWSFTTGQDVMIKYNLSAHYTLDAADISGSNAIDSSPAPNYDGTIISSPSIVEGKISDALDFDGINDYIEIPRMISDDFTISFWIKTSQIGGSGAWYLGKGLVDAETPGVVFDFGTSLMNSKLAFGVYATTISSTSNINDNQWHHCVATRSGSNGEMKVYVDGGLPEATAVETTASLISPPRITIGRIQTVGYYFKGLMDDVAIWSRVLSQAEIQNVYEQGLLGYPFDNTPPAFYSNPFTESNARECNSYSATIVDNAVDPDPGDTLVFSKTAGPSWLQVASDGSLSGLTSNDNTGVNAFTVRVEDTRGGYNEATMNINVVNTFSGELGMSDFADFAEYWFKTDCPSVPPCNPADINGDGQVDVDDLMIMAANWLNSSIPIVF